jgi:hypothetical protein
MPFRISVSLSGGMSAAGQKLCVDGNLIMTNAAVTAAENTTGYWKVGCGNLDYTGPAYFTGQIQYAAVYTVALTAVQVKEHYRAG